MKQVPGSSVCGVELSNDGSDEDVELEKGSSLLMIVVLLLERKPSSEKPGAPRIRTHTATKAKHVIAMTIIGDRFLLRRGWSFAAMFASRDSI